MIESEPVFQQVGVVDYLFSADWVPSKQLYGALPLLAGTLITSAIALLLGIPVAVATALFVTELAPRRIRGPLTIVIDLLAAVPSVVYGLWGFFFLIPKLKPAEEWFADTFSFIPFIGGTVTGPNYFVAGLILAIMILPIASAISREVISTVPREHKEAALALGATRWEMIRMAVLPYARGGIAGGAMLGLGRAIGETIAVTLVIGNAPVIGDSIFQQGYTLAAVIANEFGEAASDELHRAALIGAGLVLFVLTLGVNAVARGFVVRAERGPRVARSDPRRGDGAHERRSALRPAGQPAPPPRSTSSRAASSRADRGRARAARAVLYYLIKQGIGAISLDFFTTDPTGSFLGDPGGIKSAILGTVLMVALASAVAVPVGVGVAIWLVEFGRESKLAHAVRYFIDVMTGVPSIVFGLFVYITLVIGGFGGSSFAGWKGSIALGAADAADRHALGRGRAAARAELAARGGLRARRAALAGRLQGRAADGAAGDRHRRAARGRARRRRDGAAAVHRRGRQRHRLRLQRAA